MRLLKHVTQKRMLVILFVALFFVSTYILVFSTPEVHGVSVVDSIPSPEDSPKGLTWDGQYLWHSDSLNQTIYKLNPSNGEVIDSFDSPGIRPSGLTWDGEYLWNADFIKERIYKLNPSTGVVVDSIDSPGDDPRGLAWDGQYLWCVDDSYDEEKIYKLNPSNGDVIDSFDSPGDRPSGLTWDGQYLWHTDNSEAKIYKLKPSNGKIIDSFDSPGDDPEGLTWDGQYLWCADDSYDEEKIYKIDPLLVGISRPSVEITAPSNSDTVQGTITIFAFAKDGDGIEKVEFYIDGSLEYTDTNTSDNTYAYDWDSTSVSNGKCTIKVTAYDMLSNTNSDSITVTVNNFALVELITISCPDQVSTDQPFTIAVTLENKGVMNAEIVTATIDLPNGFSLTSGSTKKFIGTIRAGESKIVDWTAKAAEPGDFSITVRVSSANGGADSSTTTLHVNPGVVYILTKTTYTGLPPFVWMIFAGIGIVVVVVLKKRDTIIYAIIERVKKGRRKVAKKAILAILLASLFFVSTLILAFSTTKGLSVVRSIRCPKGDDVAVRPEGLAWDGENLWLSIIEYRGYGKYSSHTAKIYKLNPSNGEIVTSFASPGPQPKGLTWDGQYLWNADASRDKIYKLNPSNGEIVASFASPGRYPRGLAWDGHHLWNADTRENKIYQLNPSNGKIVRSFDPPGDAPVGLEWDGQFLWNADPDERTIYKLNASNCEIVDSFVSPERKPRGLAWDGQFLWNVDGYDFKIYKLRVPHAPEPPFCLGTLAISIIMPVTLIAARVLRRRE